MLGLIFGPLVGSSQVFSLSGQVKEKYHQTPIPGAQICVGDQVLGISGHDGTYSVNLRDHGRIVVIYKQVGYVAQPYGLVVNGATKNNAELYKKSAEAQYWRAAAQTIKMDAAQRNNSPGVYATAWLQIDASELPPEAKAEAAKQIFNVLPAPNQAPPTLLAYKGTDASKMQDSAKFIDQALISTGKLKFVNVPAPVAADIAATQLTQFEKTKNTKVGPKFFEDFNEKFGSDASVRLKTQVKQKQAAASAETPPM
jgi:hypothetical protein